MACPAVAGFLRLPGTRALVISAEQSLQRVRRDPRQLAEWNREQPRDGWEDRIVIVARDRELSRVGARQLLTLDERGLALLRRASSTRPGMPATPSASCSSTRSRGSSRARREENDNDAMTALLDPLQALATDLGVYVLAIHHEPHAERADPVGAARGASTISAVPQVLWRLAQAPDLPNRRELLVAGNEVERGSITFEVALRPTPGASTSSRPPTPSAPTRSTRSSRPAPRSR